MAKIIDEAKVADITDDFLSNQRCLYIAYLQAMLKLSDLRKRRNGAHENRIFVSRNGDWHSFRNAVHTISDKKEKPKSNQASKRLA